MTTPARARGFVLFAALAFASSGPLAKLTVGMPPAWVASMRTLLAAFVLLAFRPRALARGIKAMSRRDLHLCTLAGVLLGLHFTTFIAGMGKTSLPAGVALLSLEPLSVIVACAIVFREMPTIREALGIGIAMVGGIIVASGASHGEHRIAGDLLVLVAVALYGLYVACARAASGNVAPATYITLVYLVAGLSLIPWGIATTTSASWPQKALIATLALALVPTLVGHSLVQAAARFARPALLALVPPGETVGALILGALFMHTFPTLRELAGCTIALAGALVAMFAPRLISAERPEQQPPAHRGNEAGNQRRS